MKTWTKNKPNKPGIYYWCAGKKKKIYIVEVRFAYRNSWENPTMN